VQKLSDPLPNGHGTLAWQVPPGVVPPLHHACAEAMAAVQSPHEVQNNRSPLDWRK
jgi:hypothetical protein